jgi:hypothetical protein
VIGPEVSQSVIMETITVRARNQTPVWTKRRVASCYSVVTTVV